MSSVQRALCCKGTVRPCISPPSAVVCACTQRNVWTRACTHARMHTFIVTQYEVNTRTHHCCEMKGSRIQSVGLCSPQTGIKARRRNICCNDHDDNLNSAGVRRRSTKGLSLRSALKSATDFYKTSKLTNMPKESENNQLINNISCTSQPRYRYVKALGRGPIIIFRQILSYKYTSNIMVRYLCNSPREILTKSILNYFSGGLLSTVLWVIFMRYWEN